MGWFGYLVYPDSCHAGYSIYDVRKTKPGGSLSVQCRDDSNASPIAQLVRAPH